MSCPLHSDGAVAPDLLAGDRPAVDGVGSVDDAQHACPGVEVGEGVVVADAGAAEYLDGAVDDSGRDRGGGDFDGGDLGACTLSAVLVDEPSSLEYEQAGLLDLDARPGDQVLHDPLVDERAAERDPRFSPVDQEGQGPLGHADRPHRVVNAAWPEAGLGYQEPVTLAGEPVLDGHAYIVEDELRVA